MGVVPTNLRIEGNFPALKNSLITNFKILAETSDEIFKAFGGIVLKVVAFLLLINFIFLFSILACDTLLKENTF